MLGGLARVGRVGVSAHDAGMPAWASGMRDWVDFERGIGTLRNPPDTHADTIYVRNKAGVYEPRAANTLVRSNLGLQTVPTRTNLASRSWRQANWGLNVNAAREDGPGKSVTGAPDARFYRASTGNAYNTIYGATSFMVIGDQFTASCRAKKGTTAASLFGMRVQGAYPQRADAVFNLVTGQVAFSAGNTYTGVSARITLEPDGYYRCELTGTVAGSDATSFVVGATDVATASWEGTVTTITDAYATDFQIEKSAFASPPIPTDGAAVTVTGNRPVTNLDGKLGQGVAGIIQVDIKDPGRNYVAVLNFYNSVSGSADRVSMIYSGGNLGIDQFEANTYRAGVIAAAWAQGLQTIAFAAGPNFLRVRKVGAAAVNSGSANWPALDRAAVGSYGFNASGNTHQFTKKLALRYGPVDQAVFDAVYAKAEMAAAA